MVKEQEDITIKDKESFDAINNELIDKEVDLLNNCDLSVRKKVTIIIYFNPIFFQRNREN